MVHSLLCRWLPSLPPRSHLDAVQHAGYWLCVAEWAARLGQLLLRDVHAVAAHSQATTAWNSSESHGWEQGCGKGKEKRDAEQVGINTDTKEQQVLSSNASPPVRLHLPPCFTDMLAGSLARDHGR